MDAVIQISSVAEVEERLLTIDSESRLFWRLRRTLLARALSDKFRHSRLRVSLVVVLSIAFWIGLYWLFLEGFRFLAGVPDIIQPLFNTFFASLFLMLIFSSALILYSGLYRSSEATFLLTQPVRPERVFAHKYHEAVWFSSWGLHVDGHADACGLRRGRRIAVVLLRVPAAVHRHLCILAGGARRHRVFARRKLDAARTHASACGRGRAGRGRRGMDWLVDFLRNRIEPAHGDLVSGNLRSPAVYRAAVVAKLVA